jgi:hypothetical protein
VPEEAIVRTLIHEVVVDLDDETSEIVLVIHWKGGVHAEVRVPTRRRGQNATHTSPEAIDAVRQLARICPDLLIASVLNRNDLSAYSPFGESAGGGAARKVDAGSG